jgi:hypothetical protein
MSTSRTNNLYNDFGSCELVFEIQPEESLTIQQRVHLLALVGSLAGFVEQMAMISY